jgi:hypothetical protein
MAALCYLLLTESNRSSLVFLGGDNGSVLFSSDSPLDFSLPTFSVPLLATAPHHGSDSNAAAIAAVVQQAKEGVTWVRSSYGRMKSTRFMAQSNRFCTLCNGMLKEQRHFVILRAETGTWRPTCCTPECTCR